MQPYRGVLLLVSVFIFLSLGGFFHLSVLRLACHHQEQRTVAGSASDRLLRLTERDFLDLVNNRDELRIGDSWYDIRSVDIRQGYVLVRLQLDMAESYWRELLVNTCSKSPEEKVPVAFLFYYLSSTPPLSVPASPSENIFPLPAPGFRSAMTVVLFRPPCGFSPAC